eukprot:TRINITY_DN8817_c0_g1_i4.p1 TRINITY_DN8817_c0_g1~~TRINITY_DN8817_c0_g1_i4.p1  ORF type:complete len:901 (+),score=209.67 TRINITY_DN8817_c0_g1_i4:88-2790(+)
MPARAKRALPQPLRGRHLLRGGGGGGGGKEQPLPVAAGAGGPPPGDDTEEVESVVVVGGGWELDVAVCALRDAGLHTEGVVSRAGLERCLRRESALGRFVRCVVLCSCPPKLLPGLAHCRFTLAPTAVMVDMPSGYTDADEFAEAVLYNVRVALQRFAEPPREDGAPAEFVVIPGSPPSPGPGPQNRPNPVSPTLLCATHSPAMTPATSAAASPMMAASPCSAASLSPAAQRRGTRSGSMAAGRRINNIGRREEKERRLIGTVVSVLGPMRSARWELPEATELAASCMVSAPATAAGGKCAPRGGAAGSGSALLPRGSGSGSGSALLVVSGGRPGRAGVPCAASDSVWLRDPAGAGPWRRDRAASGEFARRWGHCLVALGTQLFLHGGLRADGAVPQGAAPRLCRGNELPKQPPMEEPAPQPAPPPLPPSAPPLLCDIHGAAGWSRLPDDPLDPWGAYVLQHSVTEPVHGRYLLFFGGNAETGLSNDVCIYDAGLDNWLPPGAPLGAADLGGSADGSGGGPADGMAPQPRCGHTACFDEQRYTMVIFGGRTSRSTCVSEVYMHCLRSRRWALCPVVGHKPRGRHSHSAILHRKKEWIIAGGCTQHSRMPGSGERELLGDCWLLSLAALTWRQIRVDAAVPRRCAAVCFLVTDPPPVSLLLLGGYGEAAAPAAAAAAADAAADERGAFLSAPHWHCPQSGAGRPAPDLGPCRAATVLCLFPQLAPKVQPFRPQRTPGPSRMRAALRAKLRLAHASPARFAAEPPPPPAPTPLLSGIQWMAPATEASLRTEAAQREVAAGAAWRRCRPRSAPLGGRPAAARTAPAATPGWAWGPAAERPARGAAGAGRWRLPVTASCALEFAAGGELEGGADPGPSALARPHSATIGRRPQWPFLSRPCPSP